MSIDTPDLRLSSLEKIANSGEPAGEFLPVETFGLTDSPALSTDSVKNLVSAAEKSDTGMDSQTLSGDSLNPLVDGNPPAGVRKRWQSIDSPLNSRLGESNSRFLHVVEQGALIRRSGSRVMVSKKKEVLLEVPAMKLQGILLYGNIQVTTQCLQNLLSEGVWLSFFSRNGAYRGRLQPPADRGGRLRLRQWERSRDSAYCLAFGRAIVRGKIIAQKEVAAAYAKNYLAETLGEGHRVLNESLDRVNSVDNLDELRGVEGNAGRAYFDLFRRWNRSEMPFEGRSKPAAKDPINALPGRNAPIRRRLKPP
jgi:hypothetical protein